MSLIPWLAKVSRSAVKPAPLPPAKLAIAFNSVIPPCASLSSAKVTGPPVNAGKPPTKPLKSALPRSTVRPPPATETAAMFRLSRSLRLVDRWVLWPASSVMWFALLSSTDPMTPSTWCNWVNWASLIWTLPLILCSGVETRLIVCNSWLISFATSVLLRSKLAALISICRSSIPCNANVCASVVRLLFTLPIAAICACVTSKVTCTSASPLTLLNTGIALTLKLSKLALCIPLTASTCTPPAPTLTAATLRFSRPLRLIARRLVRELLSLASTVMLSSSAKRRPFTSNACAVPSLILTTPATLAESTSMVETVSDPNWSLIERSVSRSLLKVGLVARLAKSAEAAPIPASLTCKVTWCRSPLAISVDKEAKSCNWVEPESTLISIFWIWSALR